MNPEELLDTMFDCQCGRTHTVPVKKIKYEEDALNVLPEVLGGFIDSRSILIVADSRTFSIAGRDACRVLEKAGWSVQQIIIPDTKHGSPACDDITYNKLKDTAPSVGFALAVGCGVINDLTKWLTFERDIPYAVVATAATMNGFTAANVAPMLGGVKSLVRARAPLAVFAKPSVICQGPFELTSAGLGDCLAKPVSTADWLMNHIFFDEYFCSTCSQMLNELESAYFNRPGDIKCQKPEAIKAVFNALLYSGIAMTLVGTSAPASGGEHLLSHTLDMMSALDNGEHDLHGRQVGVGTIFASALYERILKIQSPEYVKLPSDIDEPFWRGLAPNVRQQYEQKKALLSEIQRKITDCELWRRFLETVAAQVRSPREIKRYLAEAGGAHRFADIKCSRRRFLDAVLHMHEIRARPTVVDLAWILGILPDAAEQIIDQWLTPDGQTGVF
jgi:glycerol-1-phosphate dehydrogenase [NAD(P)+]